MKKILICTNHRANPSQPSCATSGSETLASRLEQYIATRQLNIQLERGGCLGQCTEGPNLKLVPGGPLLSHLTPDQDQRLFQAIERFCLTEPASPESP